MQKWDIARCLSNRATCMLAYVSNGEKNGNTNEESSYLMITDYFSLGVDLTQKFGIKRDRRVNKN
ncbi:hypothetical protein AYJ08_10910 [Brevibacillus sp. SKDU10]|nr:hypothetical protein AYJ08_10910 [Brevibacillus sp. SKDU10]